MVYLSITTTVCLLIRTQAHLIRHPSSSAVNDEPHAHSYQDNSLWCTPGLRTRTASFLHRNVPSWLKCLLAQERRVLIGQYGNFFLSPSVQRLLVSVDYPCTLRYLMSTSCCAHPFQELFTYTIISFVGCSQGIRNSKIFWSNDLPPLSEGFLNGPLL